MLSALLLLLLTPAALAAPHPHERRGLLPVAKAQRVVPGSYIVTLRPGADKGAHIAWAGALADDVALVTHAWEPTVLNGFVGRFSASALDTLRKNNEVASIEENAIVHKFLTTQDNAPWGLHRISHKGKLAAGSSDAALAYKYGYDARAGSGVDIYVIDTGINTAHKDFGGRARWGITFGNYSSADGDGHGTHCAGIAVSTTYGVAKKASAIAVKVLGDDGSGELADVISGINWVVAQAKASKRPSVINLSLGGGTSTALDSAVAGAVKAGVHVAVAAGNDAVDAKDTSPARVASAVTVGASNVSDARAWFSNYGSVVDIFAPGETITSTWIGSTTATHVLSGTSMATPHISGLIAYLISLNNGKNYSPAAMVSKLQAVGHTKLLSDIPSGTRNELAYNADGW